MKCEAASRQSSSAGRAGVNYTSSKPSWSGRHGPVQRLVRRSGQMGHHVPHEIGTKVHDNCAANTDAKIPHRTGDAYQGVEGYHPRPGEVRDVMEPSKEEHGSG